MTSVDDAIVFRLQNTELTAYLLSSTSKTGKLSSIGYSMDELTIKTPNPKSRLFFKIDLLTDFAACVYQIL